LARSSKSPLDVTGRKAEKLTQEYADKLAERAGQITTINELPTPTSDTEIKVGKVTVNTPTRKMQVNTDLVDVTIGQGNTFTFYRGNTYVVPEWVYRHLDEKGLVLH